MSEQSSADVPAVTRALDILALLVRRGPLPAAEIAVRLDLPRSSTLGILRALECGRAVIRTKPRGPFALGPLLIELGQAALDHHDLRWIARPYLQNVVDTFGETVNLAVLAPDRRSALYIEKIEGIHSVRIAAWVGKVNPCHCTAVGKALLLGMEEQELSLFVDRLKPLSRFTRNTLLDAGELLRHLKESRRRGYTFDDEEHEEGVRCVAVPVTDGDGHVVAAVSVAAPSLRMTPEYIPGLVEHLRCTAKSIGAEIDPRRNEAHQAG